MGTRCRLTRSSRFVTAGTIFPKASALACRRRGVASMQDNGRKCSPTWRPGSAAGSTKWPQPRVGNRPIPAAASTEAVSALAAARWIGAASAEAAVLADVEVARGGVAWEVVAVALVEVEVEVAGASCRASTGCPRWDLVG